MADLETLRRAFRSSAGEADSVHLSEDRWERLACNELGPVEREAALDHIVGCSLCSDTYRAIELVRSQAAPFDTGVPGQQGSAPAPFPARRRLWSGLGLLAIAAAVTMAIILPDYQPDPASGGAGDQPLRSTAARSPVHPVTPVDQDIQWATREALVLRWRSAGPSVVSVVEILDANGELVWSSPPTDGTEVGWPSDVATEPGRYYWRVVVTGAGAGRVASELVSFDLVD